MAVDGEVEIVEPLQKRAMLLGGGIGWVEMTAAVWMAAVRVATAAMACRVKVTPKISFHSCIECLRHFQMNLNLS